MLGQIRPMWMNKDCFNLFDSLILGMGVPVERTVQTPQVRNCSLDKGPILTGVMKSDYCQYPASRSFICRWN